MKSVVDHMLEVAPRSQLRGLVDDYGGIEEEVLFLQGEIHLDRKPVSTSTNNTLVSRPHSIFYTPYDNICCASINTSIHANSLALFV